MKIKYNFVGYAKSLGILADISQTFVVWHQGSKILFSQAQKKLHFNKDLKIRNRSFIT